MNQQARKVAARWLVGRNITKLQDLFIEEVFGGLVKDYKKFLLAINDGVFGSEDNIYDVLEEFLKLSATATGYQSETIATNYAVHGSHPDHQYEDWDEIEIEVPHSIDLTVELELRFKQLAAIITKAFAHLITDKRMFFSAVAMSISHNPKDWGNLMAEALKTAANKGGFLEYIGELWYDRDPEVVENVRVEAADINDMLFLYPSFTSMKLKTVQANKLKIKMLVDGTLSWEQT